MRVGDLEVTLVPTDRGAMRELASGHVVARPGQVYVIRIRNLAPARAKVDVAIDGRAVTGNGLVIAAGATIDLERPVHEVERGRFTVFPEGRTDVFGEDGGRDNPDLGLVRVRFQREAARPLLWNGTLAPAQPLPMVPNDWDWWARPHRSWPDPFRPTLVFGTSSDSNSHSPRLRSTLHAAPEPPRGGGDGLFRPGGCVRINHVSASSQPTAAASADGHTDVAAPCGNGEMRAAGTGLTGESAQTFSPVVLGSLEGTVTELVLRLVIGDPGAAPGPRPLPAVSTAPTAGSAPERPESRP